MPFWKKELIEIIVYLKKFFVCLILFVVLGSGIYSVIYGLNKAQKVRQAVQMYQEFLAGERKAGDIDIYYLITPTGEPDRQYRTKYTLVDSNGDGIPELHILSGREYTIYSCKDGEMYEFEAFFSDPWLYVPLNNGALIFRDDIGITLGDFYYYFEMDARGNPVNELKFSWMDANENLLCDGNDEFMFDGNLCTKEEWFARTRKYLFTDEEGKEQIRNQAEWITLCEQIWHSDYDDDMPEIESLNAGEFYSIALCRDKTLWSWGHNESGKLGVETDSCQDPQKIEGLEGVVKIADGDDIVYALLETGEVYAWGKDPESLFLYTEKKQYTPVRLEELENIVDMDAKGTNMFALDGDDNLYALGLQCFSDGLKTDVCKVFSGQYAELGKDIERIFTGAGNYHYFLRKDGTVFSIMECWYYGYDSTYAFIFPASGERGFSVSGKESYYRPEELETVIILNENTKMGYTVYYDLPGISGAELLSSDDYTVFISKTDGTLWYWNSDRIKYHDAPCALANPEDGEESCTGEFVEISLQDTLKTDGEASVCPRVTAMQSGLENTVFLTDTGEVFISRYITCGTEDVSYYRRINPDITRLPNVLTIKNMKLKKLVFEKVRLKDIVSISTDGKYTFSAVDVNGAYYTIK